MEFKIQNLEVIQNWDKTTAPCIYGIPDSDQLHFNSISRNITCRLPYFDGKDNLRPCTSKIEMQECLAVFLEYNLGDSLKHPSCRKLDKLEFNNLELDVPGRYQPSITISVVFVDDTYREIRRVRAFDLNALIGNIGGYIGIFVGYSILLFPDMILTILRSFGKYHEKKYSVLSVHTKKYEKRCVKKATNVMLTN
jgi:hypothetical protein